MDFSDAERTELRSYQERYLALEQLWDKKQCREDDDGTVVSADSVEEAEEQAPVAQRLQVLDELLSSGLISQEEYDSQRAEILSGI